MPRHTHFASALLGGAALALVVLTAASAQPQTHAKYGGTLYVGLSGGEPASLDPTLSRTTSPIEVIKSSCGRLHTCARAAVGAPLDRGGAALLGKLAPGHLA